MHVDSPSLASWVTSKSHVSPHHIAAFLLTDVIIEKSFNYYIFSGNFWLRKSISLSRSTTAWYSSWLCKLTFCFTSFCIKFLISFFISARRTSLIFLYFTCLYALSINSSVSNELFYHFQYHSKQSSWFLFNARG